MNWNKTSPHSPLQSNSPAEQELKVKLAKEKSESESSPDSWNQAFRNSGQWALISSCGVHWAPLLVCSPSCYACLHISLQSLQYYWMIYGQAAKLRFQLPTSVSLRSKHVSLVQSHHRKPANVISSSWITVFTPNYIATFSAAFS